MKNDFEKSLKFVLEHETVYAKGRYGQLDYAVVENEPGDSGGKTKFGLDSASHPELDLDTLTVEEASLVYKREYWERAHCYELPWPLSQVQFDGAVNCGIGQQMKFLQRVAGVVADGAWGPNTSRATGNAFSEIGVKAFSIKVCEQKEAFYRALAEKKPQVTRFLKGWLNRLDDLRKDCELV
jgi:lysozyme family protein